MKAIRYAIQYDGKINDHIANYLYISKVASGVRLYVVYENIVIATYPYERTAVVSAHFPNSNDVVEVEIFNGTIGNYEPKSVESPKIYQMK